MKDVFPSITLRGDAAKALMQQFKVGDEISGNIKFKVVGYRDSESSRNDYDNGCTIDLDAVEFTPEGAAATEEESSMDDADSAMEDFEKESMGSDEEDPEEGEHY